jgi:hypothetical protein
MIFFLFATSLISEVTLGALGMQSELDAREAERAQNYGGSAFQGYCDEVFQYLHRKAKKYSDVLKLGWDFES